jgi:hypothetical protein
MGIVARIRGLAMQSRALRRDDWVVSDVHCSGRLCCCLSRGVVNSTSDPAAVSPLDEARDRRDQPGNRE